MGRLTHLIQEDRPQVYQLDFSKEVSVQVAEILGQEAASRLAPVIAQLITQVETLTHSVSEGTKSSQAALQEASEAALNASDGLEKELAAQVEDIRKGIRRLALESRAGSKADLANFREALLRGLSNITIPDHSDALARIEGMLSDLPASESAPREWEFQVNRNRNGFIQSVSAKAK